jgi:hypothetical protein
VVIQYYSGRSNQKSKRNRGKENVGEKGGKERTRLHRMEPAASISYNELLLVPSFFLPKFFNPKPHLTDLSSSAFQTGWAPTTAPIAAAASRTPAAARSITHCYASCSHAAVSPPPGRPSSSCRPRRRRWSRTRADTPPPEEAAGAGDAAWRARSMEAIRDRWKRRRLSPTRIWSTHLESIEDLVSCLYFVSSFSPLSPSIKTHATSAKS